jgi:sugar phosphate isomerase/epimerase
MNSPMNVSYQLYSSRKFMPWDGVLKTLASLGYTQVEGIDGVYEDPAGFRALLDAEGLTMPSGHFSVPVLEAELPPTLAIARTLGIERIYAPFLPAADRPTDRDGWTAFAKRLSTIGERLRAAGLKFGWHNHEFEFVRLADGTTPMQVILDTATDLDWEADIAWIIRGGGDPAVWIKRYGGRITAVHVKDIAPAGGKTDEDGWADVGQGTVAWAKLVPALRAVGVNLFIMEHDNPADATRFAASSIQYFKSL